MSDARTLRVGCRATKFCRAQTAVALERLRELRPEVSWEMIDVGGEGDSILDALGAGMCDLHIRGVRELPLEIPEDVVLAACTERNDPFDVLVAQNGELLEDLAEGADLAVGSAREAVQIASFRDDLSIRKVSGSVDELMSLLEKGEVVAFLAAAEDVETLRWQDVASEVFPPDIFLPAAGQGTFGFLTRASDEQAAEIASTLDHLVTRQVVAAERAFLRELAVKPTDPVAVHGSFQEETLVIEALLGDEISGAILRDDLDGSPEEEDALGIRLAKLFVADGARDYLAGYK